MVVHKSRLERDKEAAAAAAKGAGGHGRTRAPRAAAPACPGTALWRSGAALSWERGRGVQHLAWSGDCMPCTHAGAPSWQTCGASSQRAWARVRLHELVDTDTSTAPWTPAQAANPGFAGLANNSGFSGQGTRLSACPLCPGPRRCCVAAKHGLANPLDHRLRLELEHERDHPMFTSTYHCCNRPWSPGWRSCPCTGRGWSASATRPPLRAWPRARPPRRAPVLPPPGARALGHAANVHAAIGCLVTGLQDV